MLLNRENLRTRRCLQFLKLEVIQEETEDTFVECVPAGNAQNCHELTQKCSSIEPKAATTGMKRFAIFF